MLITHIEFPLLSHDRTADMSIWINIHLVKKKCVIFFNEIPKDSYRTGVNLLIRITQFHFILQLKSA